MMYQKKIKPDIRCPLGYGLEIFGDKWKSRIICVLAVKKVLHYSELRKEMSNITDDVLAHWLRNNLLLITYILVIVFTHFYCKCGLKIIVELW